MASVLTVSQLNFFVKTLLEGETRLQDVLLSGELSNVTANQRSGHLYFSVKDERAVLRGVMFATSARRLRFRPADGMKVLLRGRVSLYEAGGQYQFIAEDLQPDGVGSMAMAYEQRKAALEEEGLFDPAHKRPLPAYPARIGVITSPTGDAARDMLRITGRRWPLAEIVFCPVPVQGEGAARHMVAALRALNAQKACEVILLGRGGGSLEDLWAFNDEELTRAVAASEIPVVSGIGHETDFTLCDFAADLRASTPSAAAELSTPDLWEEKERARCFSEYFHAGALALLEERSLALDELLRTSPLRRPTQLLAPQLDRLSGLSQRLTAAYDAVLARRRAAQALLAGRLDALSPLKVLSRGYAVVTRGGVPVRAAQELSPDEEVHLCFAQGGARALIIETEKEA